MVKIDTVLRDAHIYKIFGIFEEAALEARLVGGCVRDILWGDDPKDWDFATNALPHNIIAILDANGIRHIEPGL